MLSFVTFRDTKGTPQTPSDFVRRRTQMARSLREDDRTVLTSQTDDDVSLRYVLLSFDLGCFCRYFRSATVVIRSPSASRVYPLSMPHSVKPH